MRGKKVERRFGWDCHGLPVENLIEKELSLNSKTGIEKFGIALKIVFIGKGARYHSGAA